MSRSAERIFRNFTRATLFSKKGFTVCFVWTKNPLLQSSLARTPSLFSLMGFSGCGKFVSKLLPTSVQNMFQAFVLSFNIYFYWSMYDLILQKLVLIGLKNKAPKIIKSALLLIFILAMREIVRSLSRSWVKFFTRFRMCLHMALAVKRNVHSPESIV